MLLTDASGCAQFQKNNKDKYSHKNKLTHSLKDYHIFFSIEEKIKKKHVKRTRKAYVSKYTYMKKSSNEREEKKSTPALGEGATLG
jgi:hypothetical protein